MTGESVDLVADCPAGHPGADWRGSYADPGGGTAYLSISCLPCGDRPWTVAAQAARTRPKPEPAPSLRPVYNTASDAARSWFNHFRRRNA